MNVIDELVVKIVLNGQEFQAQLNTADQGVKKFAEQTAQSATVAERGAQKMVDGFSRVTKEILGIGAAILGVNGLKDLAVNLTQVAAAGERMSEAFELDPEMLNKWQGFLQAVGNQDFGTTTASLTALAGAIQQYRATLKGPFADPETLGALNRLGVTTGDLTAPGKVNDIMNRMLLTIGQNINRPENTDLKAFLLNHVPGMTPTMMRGLERSPSQATLDKYLTATAAQMQSASHMMEAITELAQALTKKLNTLLPEAEKPVVDIAKKLAAGDVVGAFQAEEAATAPMMAQGQRALHEAIKDQFKKGSWLDNFLMIGGGHHDPIITPFRHSPGSRSTAPILPRPVDTSAMSHTDSSYRGGGNVTNNNFTTNISGLNTNNPQAWADAFYDGVSNHFKRLAPQASGGSH